MEFLIILITGLLAALLSGLVRNRRTVIECVAVCAVIVDVFSVLSLVLRVVATGRVQYMSYFSLDSLGVLFAGVVALVGCIAALYSIGYIREELKHKAIGMHRVRQFYTLFHLFLASMFLAIFTTHPVLMWIAVEATTLSTIFLISFYGKPNTVEAAWKFFIINSVALLLGFLGTLIFVATSAHFGSTWFFPHDVLVDPKLLKIAFVLVVVGYGTKTGFAPLHTWLPDAHSMAPVPISSLLSGALLNVSFFALLRFKMLVDSSLGSSFSQNVFLAFGLMSVVMAALFIFTQKHFKRMLAYSSIEHMGIMALGFGVGGAGVFAALLHMIYHAMTKSLLFLSSGTLLQRYGTIKIAGIRGLRSALPLTSLIVFGAALSITGTPPFGMFITEFSILTSLITVHPLVAGIVLFALALVFIGFIKHISSMMSGEPSENLAHYKEGGWTLVPLIALFVLLITISVYMPPTLHALLTNASKL